ncbi:M23 family metallopeptidase, partial [Streptomyces sp. NPDC059168]|uniref:M23 family metallopeptidase n=1 Tax=Streptomyces sp. NPDC059168 TaxID=3346753 RepID=UPI0036830878
MRITWVGTLTAAALLLTPITALLPTAPAAAATTATASAANNTKVATTPPFQLPIPCGQRWTTSTHDEHASAYMVDMVSAGGTTEGTPALASAGGRVVTSQFDSQAGNFIVIDHGGGWQTRYLHLDRRDVAVGDDVGQGRQIGTVGNTGSWTTGAHLHYEQKLNGSVVQATIDGHLVPVTWAYNQHYETSGNCGVSTGSSLFAQSPDRSGVFQWSGNGTVWN